VSLVSKASRWALPAARAVTLAAMAAVAVVVALPAHRVPVIAALVVSVGGAAYGLRYGPERVRQRLTGLILLAAGGVALIVADGKAPGWLACGAGIIAALARLPRRVALLYAVPVAAATCLAPLARGDRDEVPAMAAACAAALILGLIIGDVRTRAATAERLLAAEQAASETRAQRDRLAERQRIAREIHDILAHTLSAQSVQLEGARLLVQSQAPAGDVLQRIRAAQRLARDSLDETRRAVQSLRDELPPVEQTVRRLADDAGAHFRQVGQPWPLEPPAALTVERTVQEGLTNARKHAPGAAVTVDLAYGRESVTVAVSDAGSDARAEQAGGGGYGLAGMRERAALIGARLESGAHGEGFRICLTVPRSRSSSPTTSGWSARASS
jgi:signal transduction histidine kinase